MTPDFFAIQIDGAEIPELYRDLMSLEIDLHEDLAGLFRLRLVIRPDGESWTWLDDERLQAWASVSVRGGVEGADEELIRGYVTQLRPEFGAGEHSASLELWGMDESVLLDRVEVQKAWPNMKDSDVASGIYSEHGLSLEIEPTSQVHDESISTPIQRETDMQFLKRLALRNGYECFVHAGTGFFRKPVLAPEAKPVLAACFGPATNLDQVAVLVDALSPVEVSASQLARGDKSVDRVDVADSELDRLGGNASSALLRAGIPAAKAFAPEGGALGPLELQSLARGVHARADWFVSLHGVVRGNAYGAALLPRDTVLVKGIGANYSGRYRVHRVSHSFAPGGYVQRVTLRRNALSLRGDEVFAGAAGALAAIA